jgi:hypothetical protein
LVVIISVTGIALVFAGEKRFLHWQTSWIETKE